MPEADQTILLYDRDCGFCRWSLQKLLAWDRRGRLKPVALQDLEAKRLLADLDERRRMDSWHLVTSGGQVVSAGAAVPDLLRLLPGGRPFAMLAAAFPRVTDAAYALIARHRSLLGRVMTTRSS